MAERYDWRFTAAIIATFIGVQWIMDQAIWRGLKSTVVIMVLATAIAFLLRKIFLYRHLWSDQRDAFSWLAFPYLFFRIIGGY